MCTTQHKGVTESWKSDDLQNDEAQCQCRAWNAAKLLHQCQLRSFTGTRFLADGARPIILLALWLSLRRGGPWLAPADATLLAGIVDIAPLDAQVLPT